ncbi:MAG: GcrA family cell cycle regulator [Pseudomonadota bacterium]
MSWTDERVETLKKLWADGLSASQIAAKLGGVSRNAVIGKVHRLKLAPRAKSTKQNGPKVKRVPSSAGRPMASQSSRSRNAYGGGGNVGAVGGMRTSSGMGGGGTHSVGATALKADQQAVAFAEPDQRPIEDIVVPIAKKLTLIELNEQTCKWPHGDPLSGEFYFCGHKTDDKSPYCKYHGKLAFQQPQDRRRSR